MSDNTTKTRKPARKAPLSEIIAESNAKNGVPPQGPFDPYAFLKANVKNLAEMSVSKLNQLTEPMIGAEKAALYKWLNENQTLLRPSVNALVAKLLDMAKRSGGDIPQPRPFAPIAAPAKPAPVKAAAQLAAKVSITQIEPGVFKVIAGAREMLRIAIGKDAREVLDDVTAELAAGK